MYKLQSEKVKEPLSLSLSLELEKVLLDLKTQERFRWDTKINFNICNERNHVRSLSRCTKFVMNLFLTFGLIFSILWQESQGKQNKYDGGFFKQYLKQECRVYPFYNFF